MLICSIEGVAEKGMFFDSRVKCKGRKFTTFQFYSPADFSEIFEKDVWQNVASLLPTPDQIEEIICSMNKKLSFIKGGIPKMIQFFPSKWQNLCVTFLTKFSLKEITQKSGKQST